MNMATATKKRLNPVRHSCSSGLGYFGSLPYVPEVLSDYHAMCLYCSGDGKISITSPKFAMKPHHFYDSMVNIFSYELKEGLGRVLADPKLEKVLRLRPSYAYDAFRYCVAHAKRQGCRTTRSTQPLRNVKFWRFTLPEVFVSPVKEAVPAKERYELFYSDKTKTHFIVERRQIS